MSYQSLRWVDISNQLSRGIIDTFEEVIELLPPLGVRGPWLAGGSVRKYMNNTQNKADYDIFFASETQRDEYCAALIAYGAKEISVNIFNRTYNLNGYTIQAIHHEYRNTLIQTMDRFDISICQFGFDGEKFVWSDEAQEDVRDLKLRFLSTTDPVYNLNRAFKYASEGYRPRDGEVLKVLRRVAKLPESVKNARRISGISENTIAVDGKVYNSTTSMVSLV
jgi:hypothetical protein